MTPQYVAFLVLSALAAISGIALARRERGHAPVAAILALGLGCDLLQEMVRPLYAREPRPFTGSARALWHVGQAAFAAYPWAVLAVALVVLGRRRPWPVTVAWLGYEGLLVLGYRALDLREHRLGLVYLGVQALLVLAMAVVVVPWWPRWRRAWKATGAAPTTTEILAAFAAGIELVILVGPLLLGEPWAKGRWTTMARPAYALYYVVAIFMQGGGWWASKR